MTALLVILFEITCHGNLPARGVQFQPTCKLCRESHKTQVWLCFLVLSLLSTSTCANSVQHPDALQTCLNHLKPAIENSDAMLYTPAVEDFPDSCTNMVLKCYMSELIMVIEEEEVKDYRPACVYDFNATLPVEVDPDCPPCETYTLQNIKTFLAKLKDILQKLKST